MKTSTMVLIIISGVLVLELLAGGMGYLFFGQRDQTSDMIEQWVALQEEKAYLPTLEDLGDTKEITCKYKNTKQFFFSWDSYILTASYSAEEYKSQKQYWETQYTFETDLPRFADETVAKEPNFSFDSFDFSLLDFEQYDLYYPKEMVFVGFSDSQNQVVFVYYYDQDLDMILESFEDFLKEDCGWE